MRALIKGPLARAVQGADARGITVLKANQIPDSNNGAQTWIVCNEVDRERIAKWFCETVPCTTGIGYQHGTCLFYDGQT